MGAVLKLERFDRDEPAARREVHSAEELQDAYARGLIEGRSQAEGEQVALVQAALQALSAELAAVSGAIGAGSRTAARTLQPLIAALLDGALPQIARARLEAALLTELLQLSEAVSPLQTRIRCGADLHPFVQACVAEAGIEAIAIDADGPPGTVEAELLGGTITWDIADVSRQLRDLMQEIMEEH